MSNSGLAVATAIYAVCCAVAFRRVDAKWAVPACYLGGWLFLPVGIFPPTRFVGIPPLDVMPLALPSRMLASKAAIVPLVVCLASFVFDAGRWRTLRPRPVDGAVLAFCLYPMVQAGWTDSAPSGAAQAVYLCSAWGASWLLGRLYMSTEDGLLGILKVLVWYGALMLPVAAIELVNGPVVYDLVYGPHPYGTDGIERYVGFRPLGFFENGNQYGLWMALAAFAAVALARLEPRYRAMAILLVAAALASQSIGAIALMLVGTALLIMPGPVRLRGLRIAAIGAVTGLIVLAGMIAVGGDRVIDAGIQAFRAVGRGSFPWRASQDLKALSTIAGHLVPGSGRWDWWIARPSRPWDLPMLIVGQFGLIGLLLVTPLAGIPATRLVSASSLPPVRLAATILVLLAIADSALNAFIFFPALMIVGGLASAPTPRRCPAVVPP